MARPLTRRLAPRRSGRDPLSRVGDLARNLWWTWNPDPQRLFAALNPAVWEATNHNPLLTLQYISPVRAAALRGDPDFLRLLNDCEQQLAAYLKARTWFQRRATPAQKRLRIAYFCAEFALHECLPFYAGGLGVLAGDHLKSASDLGLPLVGVGLLYRHGYYSQQLDRSGTTRVTYPNLEFAALPITPTGQTVIVPIARRTVQAHIWRAQVGRVPLYLLDTDLPANTPRDRKLTGHLYGGDNETRLQQELLLGVGGVRALDAVGYNANVFHLNEGHAAFCNLERLRRLRVAGDSRARAIAHVRRSSVFTTHTPVPAGHDRFPPTMLTRYLTGLNAGLQLARDELLALGRADPDNRKEPFCMTVLALRLSGRCNGVAAIHGRVSREMWTGVYQVDDPQDVPIGHVTNGIHTATWLAHEMRPLYDKYLKPRWDAPAPDDAAWTRVHRVPPAELWHVRKLLRRRLVEFVRARLREQIARRCEPLSELVAALETFDESALTLGFARRFATYKRAPLIFSDARRLAKILGDPQRPVQIVFAGKAHPADAAGQAFAQRVYQQARRAGLRGRVVLIEDYDMHVGRLLTSGCDVWLNTPRPPQEASGTSGMKPPLHGGLNCSILDGWWPEAYDGRNGWAFGDATPGKASPARDRRDAQALYDVLEHQIVPLFYTRDRQGLPRRWIRRMQASMKTVCPQFNTHRMVAEYLELYTG